MRSLAGSFVETSLFDKNFIIKRQPNIYHPFQVIAILFLIESIQKLEKIIEFSIKLVSQEVKETQ